MQPQAGHIHIGHGPGRVEPCENIAELLNMLDHHAARVVVFVKAFQPLVAYRGDHPEP
jgi:hypothetical protein